MFIFYFIKTKLKPQLNHDEMLNQIVIISKLGKHKNNIGLDNGVDPGPKFW